QPITRTLQRRYDLVELEVYCKCVFVLRALNEKHHQESDDSGSGIDDELPCIRKPENRSSDAPNNDYSNSQNKSYGCSGRSRRLVRKLFECLTDNTSLSRHSYTLFLN